MPIVRGNHSFDNHFTQIPNAWLRDARLSYKARGILAELMSHAPGFVVSRDRLAALGPDGKAAISSGLEELESHGYLRRHQERNPNGTLGATVWTTTDPVNTGIEPSTGFPATDYPSTDNRTPKKNNVKNNEVKKELPRREVEEAWEKFWSIYPRRVGKSDANKAFLKAWAAEGIKVLDGAARLAADPNLPPARYIPHPATWLNRAGWDDEPYPVRELSPEERRQKDLERSRQLREAERIESERQRREWKAAEERAVPAPDCEHGLPIWKCRECTKRLYEESQQS